MSQGSIFIAHKQVQRPIEWEEEFGSAAPLDVEIGFGEGDFLARTAHANPSRHYVGLEQNGDRIRRALRKIEEQNVKNVRLMFVDAWVAFERLFLPQTISKIYSIFPCPWPKKRHTKHRLFSKAFSKLINSRLVPHGEVSIVTDFLPYREWMTEQFKDTGFAANSKIIKPHLATRFERKWVERGQTDFFEFKLIKTTHIDMPLREDAPLTPASADRFNPDAFRIHNQKAPTASVIVKEFISDQQRRKSMVRLLVAEEHLVQHVWIVIAFVGQGWVIAPAEGQSFIPTQGIVQAVHLVRQACLDSVH